MLSALAAVFCLAGTLYLVLAALAVRRFKLLAPKVSAAKPAATLLKPLHGAEPELYENLLSFCDQDYPVFQLVFGLREADDPAAETVRRVMADRPHADISLVIDGRVHGSNLKVSNLENALAAAKYDLLVISDSDMRVTPGYLSEVASPFDDARVGLVTCLYRGRCTGGLWSRLGTLFINHGFLPSALIGWALAPGDACFGATMALRRQTLERIGGFAAFRDKLADDYALGAAVKALGLELALSAHLPDTLVAEADLSALFRHELRWARTIRSLAPVGYAASLVTQPVILAALFMLLSGFTLTSAWVFGIAFFFRLAMVGFIDRALGSLPTPLWLVPFRDLLSFMVFVASFCGNRIDWRDQRFRLAEDGSLVVNGDT